MDARPFSSRALENLAVHFGVPTLGPHPFLLRIDCGRDIPDWVYGSVRSHDTQIFWRVAARFSKIEMFYFAEHIW